MPVLQAQVPGFFQDLGLRDIWREKHPADRYYTYYSGHFQTHSRLDMFLGTGMISNKTVTIDMGPQIYSDHSPVIMKWVCFKQPVRPFLWHLNNYFLEAKGVKEEMVRKIHDF